MHPALTLHHARTPLSTRVVSSPLTTFTLVPIGADKQQRVQSTVPPYRFPKSTLQLPRAEFSRTRYSFRENLTIVHDARGHSRSTAKDSAFLNGSPAAIFPSALTGIAAAATTLATRLQATNAIILDAFNMVGTYPLYTSVSMGATRQGTKMIQTLSDSLSAWT